MFLTSCQDVVYDYQFYKEDVEDLDGIDYLWAQGFIITQVVNSSSALAQEIGGAGRIVLMYDVDHSNLYYDRLVIGRRLEEGKQDYFYHIGLCKYKPKGQPLMTIPIIYMNYTMLDLVCLVLIDGRTS